ncbi:MAG: hypothetical protein LUC92_04765 [Clostridiales bacterium]|nr:hypothetical protein [Clostridiales bacterium]
MAGTKDNSVVAVVTALTQDQAAELTKEIIKAKNKYAPLSRGTIASGKNRDVGRLIQNGREQTQKCIKTTVKRKGGKI